MGSSPQLARRHGRAAARARRAAPDRPARARRSAGRRRWRSSGRRSRRGSSRGRRAARRCGRCRARGRRAAARRSCSASSRKPKRASRLLLGDAERVEDLLLDVGAVDTDRPAADLRAVEHDVVGARAQRARVRRRSPVGAVNGWCSASQRSSLVVALEHREVDDPEQRRGGPRARGRSGARARAAARRARSPATLGCVGDDQQQVAGLRRRARSIAARSRRREQELRDRRAPACRPPARTPTRGRRRRSA